MKDRFMRARELFLEVCDLPPRKQNDILDERCADDPELRAEVDSLLAHHDVPTSALPTSDPAPSPSASGEHPQRIGDYRITGVLGSGGMGIVYLAVRDDPQARAP